jgi:hypothetical protein
MKTLGLLFLLVPVVASSKPPEALCYLAKEPQVQRKDSPIDRGIDVEIVCAHVNSTVLSADAAKLDLTDGKESLITLGRAFVESYKQKNPRSSFFTSRALNAVQVTDVSKRVARLQLNATALPKGNKALIQGQVRLGVAGTRKKTLETTAGAIRTRKLGAGIEVKDAGYSNGETALTLTGGAVYAGLQTAPAGVEEADMFGTRCFVLPKSVPDSAKVVFHIRTAEPMTVPVHIELPLE